MATTLDPITSALLDAYLDGKDVIVKDAGPCKWPVLYMPSGEGDTYPWRALRDETRYRSDQVIVAYLPHRHMADAF